MREIIFETEVQNKLQDLKKYLVEIQGEKKASKTIKELIESLETLDINDFGYNMREKFNIDCPSDWFIYYSHMNYFIYSKSETKITFLKMYDYRQDFLQDLFGISMRSLESIKFWGE